MLTATAALICCDAWFDVLLDWNSPDWWVSVLMAALVEVPVAVFLLLRARVPLIGGIRRRQLTIEDIEVHTDPTIERLLRRLGRGGPATPEALAVALGLRLDAVTAKLSALERQGYVRRGRGGRWRDVPHDLRMPELDEVAEADRDRYRTYLDAKYDKELRLFAIAARHRERLGPWGQGSRGNAYLTETELARFTDEYLELLLRYCQLHERSDPRVRQVALRFYAFPQSLTDELPDELPDCPQPAPAPAR
jgi:DNA-binding transcriptional ArsR family regulator